MAMSQFTLHNESAITTYSVGSPASAMVTVTDNDIVPTMSWDRNSRTIAEDAGELNNSSNYIQSDD